MNDNEAIFICGTRQFSQYQGYGRSFQFTAPCCLPPDGAARDRHGRVGPHIAAFDAVAMPGDEQYKEPLVQRELLKAYAACLGDVLEDEAQRQTGFATGNWGCGMFGGDPQLKCLIQWLAASRAGRELIYFPFGDARMTDVAEVFEALQASTMTCGDLYRFLVQGLARGQVFPKVLEVCRSE